MIGRPLIKIVLVIALVGFVAFELGSPIIVRLQVDDVAREAADEGSKTLFQSKSADAAQQVATEVVGKRHAQLKGPVKVDPAQNAVTVTVEREARSLLLKKWSETKDWYVVDATATSTAKGL